MFGFLKKPSRLRKIEQQQAINRRKIESSVCATVARGNISLQQGEYITSEDMDILQKQLTAYFSSEQSKW